MEPLSEEWRPIPEWEGFYEVSSLGGVRSVPRIQISSRGVTRPLQGRVLRQRILHDGYLRVTLLDTGHNRRRYYYVHALVLLAFVGPRPLKYEACHGPAGQLDNRVSNLRWDTKRNNSMDRLKWGCPFRTNKKVWLASTTGAEQTS